MDMIEIMPEAFLPLLLKLPGRKGRFVAGEAIFHIGDQVKNLHIVPFHVAGAA
jgi:hypothetical protein